MKYEDFSMRPLPGFDALLDAEGARKHFCVLWDSGAYTKFTAALVVVEEQPDPEAMHAAVTDVVVEEAGTIYDRRAADECWPWI